ncbi:glycogen/starch/alpha-glucan phosphorylase [Megasphaera vaginalis (ex Srinivasan et al. 2021)]|nr:glycogen/starch/alpha-glucan phosphorylase [Megasphaera vaginalis (ex Srinivasan et al. 2021)]
MKTWHTKEEFKSAFTKKAGILYDKELHDLTRSEVYQIIAYMVRDLVSDNWIRTNKAYVEKKTKQIYYFSIEFLLGRLLESNLIGVDGEAVCREGLRDLGWELADILPEERDPGLGNGGLGRLAACFIDSLAALQMPGHGCSLRYQYGLFKQKMVDDYQVELPDNWLVNGFPWEVKRADKAVHVAFCGNAYMRPADNGELECVYEGASYVRAVPYDVPIIGYRNNTVNTLRLWRAEYSRDDVYRELSLGDRHQAFLYKDSVQRISRFLYPDDSTEDGRRLRLMQEYFMVSAGVQSIIRHYKKKYKAPLTAFADYMGIHINDTHPALVIPELMRIFMDEEGLSWNQAWQITVRTVAYTNHTVLPEALERWSIPMFKSLLPRIYLILEELNERWLKKVRTLYPGDEGKARDVAVLWGGQVHMAHLAVLGSHSTNGVAEIHSQILKDSTLHQLYTCFPSRFGNKTNGISHRRWLIQANPQLAALLDDTIGTDWHGSPERLEELMAYCNDASFLERLDGVKRERKRILGSYLLKQYGVSVDVDSIFDVQIKRIHLYKRQLLNILHILHLYRRLKDDPSLVIAPRTYFFGGKAAASYDEAKQTIRLISIVSRMINDDRRISKMLRVMFLENYNVSLGQILFPAADVSEQISTAGKEASGTGNMKFMMNGALTLGTMDGANIEIRRRVGDENCVIFGLRADAVMNYYIHGGYSSWEVYSSDENIRKVMDSLINGSIGDHEIFGMLYESLLDRNDEYFVLKDFEAYCGGQREIVRRYKNRRSWLHSSAVNIAQSGYFSSDRTIRQYAADIWHIQGVKV